MPCPPRHVWVSGTMMCMSMYCKCKFSEILSSYNGVIHLFREMRLDNVTIS